MSFQNKWLTGELKFYICFNHRVNNFKVIHSMVLMHAILDMIPVALPQHRAGADLTSPCS